MTLTQNRMALGVASCGDESLLFFRTVEGRANRPISILRSENGISFQSKGEKLFFSRFLGSLKMHPDITDVFRVSSLGNQLVILYKKIASDDSVHLMTATSSDGIGWSDISEVTGVHELGSMITLPESDGKHAIFFGERMIWCAVSSDLVNWDIQRTPILKSRLGKFDEGRLLIGTTFSAGRGVFILYAAQDDHKHWSIGAALVEATDTRHAIWRSEEPIWKAPSIWHGKNVYLIGMTSRAGKIFAYWSIEGRILVEKIPKFWKVSRGEAATVLTECGKLEKYHGNPIINPRAENSWESNETFNPAAFLSGDGMVHILYRAIGGNGLSTIGYATSRDGFAVHERLDVPIYVPEQHIDGVHISRVVAENKRKSESLNIPRTSFPYSSGGGGYGGSEDPRISRVGDRLFMTYTAFDGNTPPRVALTSIALDDFLAKKWNWKRPVLISPPGETNKNWVIFPEKVHGKYAVLHSISPEVSIDYFDSLDFDGKTHIRSAYHWQPNKDRWDTFVRGVGPTPMKTKEGWLVLYHATTRDCGYKLGAMLLDLKDPTKVIARSNAPILEPKVWYENEGSKPRIIYSCGAVIKNETLFVYYGGADMVTCVATVPVKRLLESLLHSKKVTATRYVKLGDE